MKPKTVLIVAVLMGLVTSGLVYGYISRIGNEPPEEKKVAVVVAEETLRPKTVIRPGSVKSTEIPISALHPDAVITLSEAEGKIVRDTIVAGEQVVRTRLYADDEQPGLTFAIPPGKRAITVGVNEVIGVAGFIKPGDKVDVLATFDKSLTGADLTTTVLQGVEVLAIAQETDSEGEGAEVTTTVTLAVTLDEAERVTLAEERGTLRLALRPALFADDEVVRAVTPKDVLGGAGGALTADADISLEGQDAPVQRVSRARTAPKPREPEPFEVDVIRGTARETVTLP